MSLLFTTLLTYGMLAYTNIYAHYFMLGLPVFTVAAALGSDLGIKNLYVNLKENPFRKGSESENHLETEEPGSHLPGRFVIFLLIITVLYMGNSVYSAGAPIYKTYLTDIAYDEYSRVQAGVSVIPPEERDSVIAYGVLANFYYHADIVPCYKYFTLQKWLSTEKVNIVEEFMSYVKTAHPLWVIINANEKAILDTLSESYSVAYFDDLYIICRYNGQRR